MSNGDARQRLLDAALESFAEVGYHATTTREIAARVGLSSAAMYAYYHSKIDLLKKLSIVGHESARETLEIALAADGTHAARIAGSVRAFAQWHAENQTLARVVQWEHRALPPEAQEDIRALRRKMQEDVAQAVRDGVAAGEFTAPDAAGAALAIVSLCVDIARWYSPRSTRSPEELGELYGTLALAMLGASESVDDRLPQAATA